MSTKWMVFVDGENLSRRAEEVVGAEHDGEFLDREEHEYCWEHETIGNMRRFSGQARLTLAHHVFT